MTDSIKTNRRKRILSGMQPSGRLHLGNYYGALQNWVNLQKDYECFYFIADWHSLTTLYENARDIDQNIFEVAVDWLCSGLDPDSSVLFIQLCLPEHAELHLILSMLLTLKFI